MSQRSRMKSWMTVQATKLALDQGKNVMVATLDQPGMIKRLQEAMPGVLVEVRSDILLVPHKRKQK